MRRMRTENLKPNMIVARTIYDSDARILLQAGILLTDNYIRRLTEKDISSVYIRDQFDDEASIADVISDQTRLETIKVAKESFNNLENQRNLNVGMVKNVVKNIINDLLSNSEILIHLTDIRSFDDYTFAHSVNVCILSIITGLTMGYNDAKLKDLGVGALLHDIGKVKVDKEILNKKSDLTLEEYTQIKRHSEYGFNILREYPDISLLSAHIAFQHHERWDGQGYPRGLAGNDIHEYARIVAAADVYDALLADRPYRPAYSVNQAINILNRMSGNSLDPVCITALKANIAVYPIGSFVELNTGDIAIVVDVNKAAPTRPVIRIYYDKYKKGVAQPREIDLSTLSTVMITRLIPSDEIPLA